AAIRTTHFGRCAIGVKPGTDREGAFHSRDVCPGVLFDAAGERSWPVTAAIANPDRHHPAEQPENRGAFWLLFTVTPEPSGPTVGPSTDRVDGHPHGRHGYHFG